MSRTDRAFAKAFAQPRVEPPRCESPSAPAPQSTPAPPVTPAPQGVTAPEPAAPCPVASADPVASASPTTQAPRDEAHEVAPPASPPHAVPHDTPEEPAPPATSIVDEDERQLLMGQDACQAEPPVATTPAPRPEPVATVQANPAPQPQATSAPHETSMPSQASMPPQSSTAHEATQPPTEARPTSATARGTLSQLSQAKDGDRAWQPATTVARFELPSVCRQLLDEAGEDFERTAAIVERHARRGRKLVLLGAVHEGAGCTTLALCLGHCLAQRKIKTVLVDYDFTGAMLAGSLGLEVEQDWLDVLANRASLAEAVIQATEEPLAILPLCEAAEAIPGAETAPRQRLDLGILRQQYDVVLLDAGPIPEFTREQLARPGADVAVLAHDPSETTPDEVLDAIEQLRAAGLSVLGTVESFTTSPTA